MVKKIFIFISGFSLLVAMSSFVHAVAVDLAWDPPEDGGEPRGYIIYGSTTKGDYSNPVTVEIVQETYATVSGLNSTQSYYFIVKAYNCAGIGGASNEVYIEANSTSFYDDDEDNETQDSGDANNQDSGDANIKGSGGCFVTNMDHASSPESWNRCVVQRIGVYLLLVMAACLFRLKLRKRKEYRGRKSEVGA